MARTISQRISLEGGPEFRNGLKALGDAGQQAFKSLSDAAEHANSITISLTPTINALQQKFQDLRTSANNIRQKFGEVGTTFRDTGQRLALLAGVVLGAHGGFAALVLGAAKSADAIIKSAAAAGLATDKYQTLKAALEVAGLESGEVGSLINKMNKTFGDSIKMGLELEKSQRDLSTQFQNGKISGEEYVKQLADLQKKAREDINVFTRLGVTAETAMNKPDEAIRQLIIAFSKLPEGIEKSSLEMEVFGKKGTKFAAVANEGIEAFDALMAEMRRIAPPIDIVTLKIGNELKDAFEKFTIAAENARVRFFLLFGPATTSLLNAMIEAIVNNRQAFQEFGTAAAAALAPLIEQVRTFITEFKLDPSSIDNVKSAITNFVTDIVAAVKIVIGIWNGFVAVMQVVANGINAIFGTELSGRALAIGLIIASWTGIFAAVGAAISLVIAVIGFLITAFGGLNLAIVGIGLIIGFVLGKGLIAAVEAVPGIIESVKQALIDGWNGTVANFQMIWDGAMGVLTSAWNAFKDWVLQSIQPIIDKVQSLLGLFASASGAGGPEGVAAAGGGLIRGAGTSVSDSIRAWLSDGEYVARAKAVKYYGVDFFNALNQMRIPKMSFAMGGLASALDSTLPRQKFATGGPVVAQARAGNGNTFTLVLGSEMFAGLTGPDDVMDRLNKFAVKEQVRSAGRKPAWKS